MKDSQPDFSDAMLEAVTTFYNGGLLVGGNNTSLAN